MLLKDVVVTGYKSFLATGVPIRADWAPADIIVTHGPIGEDMEGEDDGDVLSME